MIKKVKHVLYNLIFKSNLWGKTPKWNFGMWTKLEDAD